ncbi:TetR/AcrR family transcriptional regulator [Flavobacterium sp. HJSW_4]|uniref:TetR/AcrR family transcriptional regulator n=1 Tax=Flavobacterium sp. HJSW_4 TaxID=3344660 RepID=UPI0035F43E76
MSRKYSVKERILDTASRLFYHQGFNATGINQIIAEADIAIGSLYKHYRSKNDLLCHYLEKQAETYFTNLEFCLQDEKTPVLKILKLIDYRIKLQEQADCLGCHFIKINAEMGRKDQRVEQLISKHKQHQRDFIEKIIGEIGEMENLSMKKEMLSNTIFLTIEGAVVSAGIHGNTDDLKSVKKFIKQIF